MGTIIIIAVISAIIVFIGIPVCKGVYYLTLAKKYQLEIDSTAGMLIGRHLEGKIDVETVAVEMEKAVNNIISERWTEAYKQAIVNETVKRISLAKEILAMTTIMSAIDEHRATKQ